MDVYTSTDDEPMVDGYERTVHVSGVVHGDGPLVFPKVREVWLCDVCHAERPQPHKPTCIRRETR